MGLFGRRPPPYRKSRVPAGANALASGDTLTASGERITKGDMDAIRRLPQSWQTRSFTYYDTLGEIKFAAQFYARMLAPLKLYAAEENEDGDIVPTDNKEAKAALARIQDPGGGRSGLLSTYGRLMFLTGECYLLVTLDEETGIEQWEMLSTDELKPQSGVFVRYKAPSLGAEEYKQADDDEWEPLDKSAVAYRLWKRHPRFSQLADATMQGVLDLCEELTLLTKAVRSRARSRLAGSGVLFLDDKISPPPPAPDGDEDALLDPWLADLIDAMTRPIVDEGSASAVVPLVTRVAVPEGMSLRDLVYHLALVDPTQLYPETGLRTECIDRIAIGLDMPPEILKGLQDSNHWSAWMVDEQTWKAHGEPIASQLVDDLSSSFLRPELKSKSVAGWQRYSIAYDATAIINHPDRTKDAISLYDRGAVGTAALRDAGGFDEDDAPTEEDRQERIGIAVRDGSLALTGVPSQRDTPTAGPAEPDDAPVPADAAAAAPGPPGSAPDLVGSNGAGAARIIAAADMGLLRAREVAGNRLRTLAKREPDLAALIDGVRAGQVAPTLGRDRVRELHGPSTDDLVAGARGLIVDALRVQGVGDEDVAARIARSIEQHAALTLYDEVPGPLPRSFQNYVETFTALTLAAR